MYMYGLLGIIFLKLFNYQTQERDIISPTYSPEWPAVSSSEIKALILAMRHKKLLGGILLQLA